MSSISTTRTRALALYRQLLRGAKKMPTPNRQNFVIHKTKEGFHEQMYVSDLKEIEFQLRLGDTHLDSVLVQAEHLTQLRKNPDYIHDI